MIKDDPFVMRLGNITIFNDYATLSLTTTTGKPVTLHTTPQHAESLIASVGKKLNLTFTPIEESTSDNN